MHSRKVSLKGTRVNSSLSTRREQRLNGAERWQDDRICALFQNFHTLSQLGLAITHARINTEKGAAIDSFCLTGPDGKKITDSALLRQLKTNLEEACLIPG